MMGNYQEQVRLLVQILPFIAQYREFALKGGTAINLFLRDLPRLSIDIDLVYLPLSSREKALTEIRQKLDDLAKDLQCPPLNCSVVKSYSSNPSALRLVVKNQVGLRVKIEVNPVLRGTVHPVSTMQVSSEVESRFGYAEIQLASFADIYGGKICAALDRQHPRDLFDVKELLASEGISATVRKTFLIYLASHNRPMSELLRPTFIDLTRLFDEEFRDMTESPVFLPELIDARKNLLETIHSDLTSDERFFLLSLKQGKPDWQKLGIEGVSSMPAIRWKLRNIDIMNETLHKRAIEKLERVLF